MTLIERISRAICREMNIDPDGCRHAHVFRVCQDCRVGDALVTIRNWEAAEHVARAVIRAMREPTPAMLDGSRWVDPQYDDPLPSGADYWRAMIDAALSNPSAIARK